MIDFLKKSAYHAFMAFLTIAYMVVIIGTLFFAIGLIGLGHIVFGILGILIFFLLIGSAITIIERY